MDKKLLLAVVFIGAFVGAAVANVPLSFALKTTDLATQGVSWQQARGTIWHGQVTGLAVQGDVAGAVEGDFSLVRFISGKPGHLLHWSGPYGRGNALAALFPGSVQIRKGQAAITFDATRISSAFPAQDVSLRLINVSVDLDRAGCRSASGGVTTDALARISAVYGANWPELKGSLSCDGGEMVVSVEGKAADGTQIVANAYVEGGGQLELWDVPEGQTNALLLAGFTNEAGRYIYRQQAGSGENIQ